MASEIPQRNELDAEIDSSGETYLKCPCYSCDVLIEFPARGLGQTVSCPRCGREIVLFQPELTADHSGSVGADEFRPSTCGNYELPSLQLLNSFGEENRQSADPADLLSVQDTVIDTLAQFGIVVSRGDITRWPTITRYEVYPAKGVRMAKILSLERDIARATRAEHINILAPIPGKDTVGIEITNSEKQKVTLRELFESDDFRTTRAKIPIALGKDLYGKTVIADLAAMPHALVAGATGSGKSVCLHSIIISILYRFTPEDLRFIMIDPNAVELQIYNILPHLIVPVVTNPRKALLALQWAIDEMEKRYAIFAKSGARNMAAFNTRPLPESPPASNLVIPNRLPYVIIVLEDLAELKQTAPADVESAITRITQRSPAAGIHIIIATQTPRAEVITGVIKANVPCRIAFQVASALDSRVILDENGAERLLGHGDMLYRPPGAAGDIRCQGALVTDEEIRNVVDHAAAQNLPEFENSIHERLQSNDSGDKDEEISDEDEELVDKCIEIMRQEKKASTSLFQRRLRLGYTQAARILDILELRGYVGPGENARPREILVDLDALH